MLLIRSRALVTEERAGSSNGNSATGPASAPVWNHWALSADLGVLGVTCCEMTALHSRVLGGCNTPSMLTAPVNRLCCRLHVMFDYFIIVVATGMNEYPHPVSS